jgi:hypothetical protein
MGYVFIMQRNTWLTFCGMMVVNKRSDSYQEYRMPANKLRPIAWRLAAVQLTAAFRWPQLALTIIIPAGNTSHNMHLTKDLICIKLMVYEKNNCRF